MSHRLTTNNTGETDWHRPHRQTHFVNTVIPLYIYSGVLSITALTNCLIVYQFIFLLLSFSPIIKLIYGLFWHLRHMTGCG